MKLGIFGFILALFFPLSVQSAPPSLYLEELTWMEVRDALKDGYDTVIIPTGGTEQNGPHMALGKHNVIVHYAAGEIAKKVGHTLVAPTMAYTPEGTIMPPQGHMNYAGTISLSDATFEAVLEESARSLKQHGFKRICFVGDSGPNQAPQGKIANKLTQEWEDEKVTVLQVSHYYDQEASGQMAYLLKRGLTREQIGSHATVTDTSEVMLLKPAYIRDALRAKHLDATDQKRTGASGDSLRANREIGKALMSLKIESAAKQISASH